MKIHVLVIRFALLFGGWLITTNAFAEDLFHITASTPTVTESHGYNSVEDIVDSVGDSGFRKLIESYDSNSEASAVLDIRGLRVLVNYLPNSAQLIFQIPSLGVDKTFNGSTRDESQKKLEEFLKNNSEDILTRVLKRLVGETPIDPIAGNPASFTSQMISNSFIAGTEGFCHGDTVNSVRLAGGKYKAEDYRQETLNLLPASWSAPLPFGNSHCRPRVRVDLPLSYFRVDNAEAYGAALGISLRLPLPLSHLLPDTHTLSFTPGYRFGVAGSADMAAAALVHAFTLTGNYTILLNDDSKLHFAGMVGTTRARGLSVLESYGKIDYDLDNNVLRGGISFESETPQKLSSHPTSLRAGLTYTLIAGDDVFIDRYWDLSFSWGGREHVNHGGWNNLRLGLTLTRDNHDYTGYSFNVSYTF